MTDKNKVCDKAKCLQEQVYDIANITFLSINQFHSKRGRKPNSCAFIETTKKRKVSGNKNQYL